MDLAHRRDSLVLAMKVDTLKPDHQTESVLEFTAE